MQSLREYAKTLRRPACALAAALAALLALQVFAAQESHKPLSEKEVIELLTNDVAPPRVGQLAKQFGISFQMTASAEQHLRDAGADDSLIGTLRQLAPKPSVPPPSQPPPATTSPPVLLILSTPGDAQVYIDDEPIGTTSSEGRLKMSKLGAGEHRIRLSHAGYKDFEQTVQLVSGLLTVTAQLQPAAAATSSASPAASQPPSVTSSANSTSGGPVGAMGMFMRTASAGGQTGEVTALVPGGPAERAGIRPGYVVHSIAGHSIATQEDIRVAIGGRPPGAVVPVTYSNGSTRNTVQVTLASPSILQSVPHFHVAHDHGPPAPNYCVGWMWIFDGMITYVGQTGVSASGYNGVKHNLEFPMSEIREVKRNGFYMAALGAFHIRMKNGSVANFTVVNLQGQYQRPEEILAAIERAMTNH